MEKAAIEFSDTTGSHLPQRHEEGNPNDDTNSRQTKPSKAYNQQPAV
jgi:hypothetical protein